MTEAQKPVPPKEIEPRTDRTITASFVPIMSALLQGEEVLGKNRVWQASRAEQELFLERFSTAREPLESYLQERQDGDPLIIHSLFSFSADEINSYSSTRGRSQISPFDPTEFGVAASMRVLGNWANRGQETTIKGRDENMYNAAELKQPTIMEVGGSENPVVMLRTTNPLVRFPSYVARYDVMMAVPDEPPNDEFELLDFVKEHNPLDPEFNSRLVRNDDYAGVVFPSVDLDQQADISWLVGLKTQGELGPATLRQALQKTKFQMDEAGFLAESEVRIEYLGSKPPSRLYQIDQPFVCWVQRNDIPIPLFAAYIDYPHWRNPSPIPFLEVY